MDESLAESIVKGTVVVPVPSLGGHAPIELFTGLPAPTPLDAVVLPGTRKARVLTVDLAAVDDDLRALREHLAAMHADTADRKEKKRLYEMAKPKGQICTFEVGDYVLWSRVNKRLQGGKLLVRWVGPFRVQNALPHSFLIKRLLSATSTTSTRRAPSSTTIPTSK
jgi:hypothetical protein